MPGGDEGSWVNLTTDDKGRIYASDQYGRRSLPFPRSGGGSGSRSEVGRKMPVRNPRGERHALRLRGPVCRVNDYEGDVDCGLYRLTDTNNDDLLDKVEVLRAMDEKGDHGVHAVVLTPDKKSLMLICGNGAKPTRHHEFPGPGNGGKDHLLRMPMAAVSCADCVHGTRRHHLPRFTRREKFRGLSSGYRNIFEHRFNRDGELFTYDADMGSRLQHLRGIAPRESIMSRAVRYGLSATQRKRPRVLQRQSAGRAQHRPRFASSSDTVPSFRRSRTPSTSSIGAGARLSAAFRREWIELHRDEGGIRHGRAASRHRRDHPSRRRDVFHDRPDAASSPVSIA